MHLSGISSHYIVSAPFDFISSMSLPKRVLPKVSPHVELSKQKPLPPVKPKLRVQPVSSFVYLHVFIDLKTHLIQYSTITTKNKIYKSRTSRISSKSVTTPGFFILQPFIIFPSRSNSNRMRRFHVKWIRKYHL